METQQPVILPVPEPTIFNRYMVIGAVVGALFGLGFGAILGGFVGGYIGKQFMEKRKLEQEIQLQRGVPQALNISSGEVPAIALDAPQPTASLSAENMPPRFAEQYLAEKAIADQAGIQNLNSSR